MLHLELQRERADVVSVEVVVEVPLVVVASSACGELLDCLDDDADERERAEAGERDQEDDADPLENTHARTVAASTGRVKDRSGG